MSDQIIIQCVGCQKSLNSNTILKHLSHKLECKVKYSEAELFNFQESSKKSAKLKKKAWKKADYESRKDEYSMKNALQYKMAKLRSRGELLTTCQNGYFERETKIINTCKLDQDSRDKLKDNQAKIRSKHQELQNRIKLILDRFDDDNFEEKCKQIDNEWTVVIQQGNALHEHLNKQFNPEFKEDERIQCKSCGKKFYENVILKHIVNKKCCKASYEGTEELKTLKEKASVREKGRLKRKYQTDVGNKKIADEYGCFLRSKEDLAKKPKIRFEEKYWYIRDWKRGFSGNRCKREIQKFRESKNLEVQEAMNRIESSIEKEIQELETCFEEVREEVAGAIGHYEFDTEGKWRKEYHLDLDFCNDMFKNVAYHMNEVTDVLYITCLQTFYDYAEQEGIELEILWHGDESSCRPYRSDNIAYGHGKIPRKVYLKIPNKNSNKSSV